MDSSEEPLNIDEIKEWIDGLEPKGVIEISITSIRAALNEAMEGPKRRVRRERMSDPSRSAKRRDYYSLLARGRKDAERYRRIFNSLVKASIV